ncbi:MAG TPA: hypothetical protein VMW91_03950 [Desulfosporosinus sp.]|nr:hypothetical protein [Desulfosporosinus sp.]
MTLNKAAQSEPWEGQSVAYEEGEDISDILLADDPGELIVEEEGDGDESYADEGGLTGKVMIQVDDEDPKEYTFTLPVVPGAEEAEELNDVEVEEDDVEVPEERDMWDWGGVSTFMPWLSKMFQSIPHHNGTETAGLERAMSFLQTLDKSISRAVRSDLKDELDIAQIEKARDEINNGYDRLEERLERVRNNKRPKRKKKADTDDGFVKEAQKITGVRGVMVTVPILLSRIARTCINGMVSGGHDIEDLFARQVKAYNLTVREQAETLQLLEDMGYVIRRDRGFLPDEDIETTKSDNFDWAANYPG